MLTEQHSDIGAEWRAWTAHISPISRSRCLSSLASTRSPVHNKAEEQRCDQQASITTPSVVCQEPLKLLLGGRPRGDAFGWVGEQQRYPEMPSLL